MLTRIDPEAYDHSIEERRITACRAAGRKIITNIELELVKPGCIGVAVKQRFIGTAIVIAARRDELLTVVAEYVQAHSNTSGGSAVRGIENVCRQASHGRPNYNAATRGAVC